MDKHQESISGPVAVPGFSGQRDPAAVPTLQDKLVELAIIRWQLREQALAAAKAKSKPDSAG